jgi:hypothetical protein
MLILWMVFRIFIPCQNLLLFGLDAKTLFVVLLDHSVVSTSQLIYFFLQSRDISNLVRLSDVVKRLDFFNNINFLRLKCLKMLNLLLDYLL